MMMDLDLLRGLHTLWIDGRPVAVMCDRCGKMVVYGIVYRIKDGMGECESCHQSRSGK